VAAGGGSPRPEAGLCPLRGTPRLGAGAVVQGSPAAARDTLQRALPRSLAHRLQRTLGQAFALQRRLRELDKRFRQRTGIGRPEQAGDAVLDDRARAALGDGDDRQAARLRLEQDLAEGVGAAGEEAIPVWVRARAIVLTHPAPAVRQGLGEGDAPLRATLWGEPRGGRAQARLADGTVVRRRRGHWSASAPDVAFEER
jgi:hypothetical protein